MARIDLFEVGYRYNQRAMEYEKALDIKKAIRYYEKALIVDFEGNHAYDRLVVLYNRNKQKEDVIRVLEKAVNVFEKLLETSDRSDVPVKLDKFKKRLEKERKLSHGH